MPAGYNRYRVHIGVEIETALRNRPAQLTIGSYHNGNPVPNAPEWTAERDASINPAPGATTCVEFVSRVFENKNKLTNGLKKLLSHVSPQDRNLVFNNSTGGHVHFSIYDHRAHKQLEIHRYLGLKELETLRSLIKTSITTAFPTTATRFLNHYTRSYAQAIQDLDTPFEHRTSEFNFTETHKGMEWRSINLLHCETNQDIITTYTIIYDILEKVLVGSIQKKTRCFRTKTLIQASNDEIHKTIQYTTPDQEVTITIKKRTITEENQEVIYHV